MSAEDTFEPAGDEYPPDEDAGEDEAEEQVNPRVAARAMRKAVLQRGQTHTKVPKTVAKTGKRILSKQKQRQALELRKAGASYAQIADQMGYKDASGASKAVKRAFGDVIQEPVTDLKAMQIERLNHMLLVIWPKVQQGDDRAINTARGLMNDLNDLMGTRDSQTTEVNITHQNAVLVIDGDEGEYIRAMKRMVGINADGTNNAALTVGPTTQQGTEDGGGYDSVDVVEAEVVGDTDQELTIVPIPAEQQKKQADSPTKTFNFGVDPTVRRNE